MKRNIDLTNNNDFSSTPTFYGILGRWGILEKAIPTLDKVFGFKTFWVYGYEADDFYRLRCHCCGKKIVPWRLDRYALCDECNADPSTSTKIPWITPKITSSLRIFNLL